VAVIDIEDSILDKSCIAKEFASSTVVEISPKTYIGVTIRPFRVT